MPEMRFQGNKGKCSPEKIKADQMHVAMFCATCGARWRDIYILSKAEDL